MSMIGCFGLCAKDAYDGLLNAVKNDRFDEASDWIMRICSELEGSAPEMEPDGCSGEVFIALFHYLKTEFGIDIRKNADLNKLGEDWREITGDYDMAVFSEQEREQLLPIADQIDFDEVTRFINDFFQTDYGNAGETACQIFFGNLGKLEAGCVLIWHLY